MVAQNMHFMHLCIFSGFFAVLVSCPSHLTSPSKCDDDDDDNDDDDEDDDYDNVMMMIMMVMVMVMVRMMMLMLIMMMMLMLFLRSQMWTPGFRRWIPRRPEAP